MENQEIETFSKPVDISKMTKEEFHKYRERLLNQITNVKETFSLGLKNIEDEFKNEYELYLKNLSQKIKEYDTLIEQHIESTNIKNKCYNEINYLLTQVLKDKTDNYKNYIKEINDKTRNLLDIFIKDDFSKGNDFIESMIKEQINEKEREKEKEELEKKIKLEEEKRKIEEEEIRNKLMEEYFLKNKNKSKIEINGEKDENSNIQSIEAAANLNYAKIILKNMSKERFELIFSQSFSIHSKLHNKNNLNSVSARTESSATIYSVSGEAAPGVGMTFDNNQINIVNNNENNTKITDITIKDSNLEDINFIDYFPNIENLKINNSKLSYNVAEKLNFGQLDSLKLEGIGLINGNFNDLFETIRKNEKMRKNLRIFSVKNNNISFLDYKKGYADNILKSMTFNNLEILDMSYNKIYLFQNQIFNSLEAIKLIDLTYNNIAFPTNLVDLLKAAKAKRCLVLMTNNLAIVKEKANIEYNKYLIQIFQEIKYPLKNIILDNIFCNNNYQDIFKIEIGKFKNSLEYLDLSNGQLEDDKLIYLLNEKWDFPNLKFFSLESNNLTEKFLNSLIVKDYNFDKKFSKLKILKLSCNNIKCGDYDKFQQFLEMYKNMEMLELKNTPIEKCINHFLKKKVMKYYDPNNKKQSEHAYNDDEKKIEKIYDDVNIKNKINITIKIVDLIYSKYTKIISSHIPHLMHRIILENKFPI